MAELRALDDGAGEKEGRRRLGDGPRAGDDAPWGADMDLGSSSEVAPLTVAPTAHRSLSAVPPTASATAASANPSKGRDVSN